MRTALKGQVGAGWSVRDVLGKVQISVIVGSQRTTVVTDLEWLGSSQAPLLTLAAAMKPLLVEGKNAKEAYALVRRSTETSTAAGVVDWPALAEMFQAEKINSGQVSERTWHRNWRLRIQRAVDLLTGKSAPVGSSGLLQTLRDKHFPKGKGAGSTDRRLQMQYVATWLKWAVAEQGADARWLPPADLKPFVGVKQKGTQQTTYLCDSQIVRLLADVKERDPRWHTAIALVACFGLRPVEIHSVSAKGEVLHVAWRKRTAKKPEGTPPRDVVGLDPEGLEGLSDNLLALLEERGLEALPAACRHDKCGERLEKYLGRKAIWQQLVAEVAEMPPVANTGTELVPYSLRHAYSDRADRMGLTDKEAALQMGHSLQIHHSHYSGTTTDTAARALAKAKAATQRRKLEAQVAP